MCIRDSDNTIVREKQIQRINEVKASRDNKKVQQALDAITKACETGEGNLLEMCIRDRAYGIPNENAKITIHSKTGIFNKTAYDAYNNMLRNTIEAMACLLYTSRCV